ncbi:MAG: ribosomal-processing cysteine protease Prp [Clostridiaceae bacterium]|nr:ribosomal-processing cysteine protease Prp [Clostridiaceae bacterium]
MLTARFKLDREDRVVSFHLDGHAGTAVKGENIICAAASAIAQTAIGSLQDIARIEPDYQAEDGLICCQVSYDREDRDQLIQIASLMASVRIGCMQLEESYGSHYITCLDEY